MKSGLFVHGDSDRPISGSVRDSGSRILKKFWICDSSSSSRIG